MASFEEYRRVPLAAAEALGDHDAAEVPLYLPSSASEPVLYRDAGAAARLPDYETLRAHGVRFLFVRHGDLGACESILERRLTELSKSERLCPQEKAKLLLHVGTAVAQDFTCDPDSQRGKGRAEGVIDGVIGCVLGDAAVASHMLQMAAHERSTASHMFVVSALSVILGVEVFGADHEMLRALGLAGMMHDIGKLTISPEVLTKPTALTPEEMQLIYQHPVESVRLLGDHPKATPAVRQMILQHHERYDGQGYPLGVFGTDLFPGSRILSIVDAFHAMLGRRAYRASVTPLEAMRILCRQAGRQFDPKLFGVWAELFERYWHPQQDSIRSISVGSEKDGGMERLERRPLTNQRTTFGARQRRFRCRRGTVVQCVYAGRLPDATASPDEFSATVHDVSRGGLCLFSEHPMYRGEVIDVCINTGYRDTWVRAEVAWCRQDAELLYKAGVQFVERIRRGGDGADGEDGGRDAAGSGQESSWPSIDVGETIAALGESEGASADTLALLEAMTAMRPLPVESAQAAIRYSQAEDARVRYASIEVLERISTEAGRDALKALLGDVDAEVREEAARAVGSLEMREALFPLRGLLDDPSDRVALAAAGALACLGEREGVGVVVKLLGRDNELTGLAAKTLGIFFGREFSGTPDGIEAARRFAAGDRALGQKLAPGQGTVAM